MTSKDASPKYAVVILIALIFACAVAVFVLMRPAPQAGQVTPGDPQIGSTPSVPSKHAVATSSNVPRSVPRTSSVLPGVPQTRDGMALQEDDPFDGRGREEQRWLDAHGYPNSVQWEHYSGASDALLQQAADGGDTLARTLLDSRQLPDGQALDRMMLSAVDGDAFALQLLDSHFASKGREGNIDAYAISRLLEMRADPSAAVPREIMFSAPLTVVERMQ